jgi:uncharacterized protein YciI
MTLIPPAQNLFVIDLHYIVSLAKIEPELDAHEEFLEDNFAAGRFIASSPKVPRTGGVIVATAANRQALEAIFDR